jgi:hypothetical protein
LDPNNFFLAAYFYTKFEESSYIYVYNTLPEFAPFLSSLKKFHLLRIPSTYRLPEIRNTNNFDWLKVNGGGGGIEH